jgi:hypothetical protein
MNQFTLTLKDNTQKAFNSFFWFLSFLHLIIISVITINAVDTYQSNIARATVFLLIFSLLFFFFFKRKIKLTTFQGLLFLLMIAFWLMQLAWLAAISLILIIVFARYVLKQKSIAIFSEQNIIIVKSLFKKVYNWREVENVVLKDHLLSVDFKNNYLIQVEINTESYGVNEVAFNQFCRQQLKSMDA